MNLKIGAISAVLAFLISIFAWLSFSPGILIVGVYVVLFFASYSLVSFLSSTSTTIRALKEKPPLKEKSEKIKADMRVGRQKSREEQTQEVKGRLEQLIDQGKDPFETGISNLEKITKKPKEKKTAAKKPETKPKTAGEQNHKK